MEPGVNRVISEPAVMLPLLGAEMSLGKAWVKRVNCLFFFPSQLSGCGNYLPLLEESDCLMDKTR